MSIDFTGSADVNWKTSMNANRVVVRAALVYCLRCLIDEEIPLNDGVFSPINLKIPTGMLDPKYNENPENYPAVFCGNVEIS